MDARRTALAEQREMVLVNDAGSCGAQEELLELVLAHLLEHHSERFKLEGDGQDRALHSVSEDLSWRLVDFQGQPLLLAGQLLQEDVCLMREVQSETEGATRHVFTSGFVIDSFDPTSKQGLPMLELHGPVPHYAPDLASSMERVFSTLRKPLWRANFSFYEWRYEEGEDGSAEGSEDLVERIYVKVEYETLIRLTQHPDHLVFTIRAHMDPLSSFAATPLACAALAAEIRSMPVALLEYKGLDDEAKKAAVLAFLDKSASPVAEQAAASAELA